MAGRDVATDLTSLEKRPDLSRNNASYLEFGLGERFFFFHVPKTGGRTIIRSFTQKFGRQKVIGLNKKRSKTFIVDLLANRKFRLPPSSRKADFYNSHIVGHLASLSIIEGRESQYHKACFWRDPADWFLSYYNWRHQKDEGRQKRPYSFPDFVKSLSYNPMCQDLLLYCADVPGWKYFFMSDRRKFEVAILLARRFDIFADISRVDDYLLSAGCGKIERTEYSNSIPKSDRMLRSLDTKTRRWLQLHNPVDYYIHRVAMGNHRAKAVSDAKRALAGRFQISDLARMIVRPYYRLKVKFLPFFALTAS